MKGMKGSEQIRSSRQPGARFDRRGGFTPLEFLVLIVMIAVQGAMVLPASGRW
jgi:type II secretory pathway pseudopilin PulG